MPKIVQLLLAGPSKTAVMLLGPLFNTVYPYASGWPIQRAQTFVYALGKSCVASVLSHKRQFLDSASDLYSIVLVRFLNANRAGNINSASKINYFLFTSNCEVPGLGTVKSS